MFGWLMCPFQACDKFLLAVQFLLIDDSAYTLVLIKTLVIVSLIKKALNSY